MFNGAGGVSGLAACLKRISIVVWVDACKQCWAGYQLQSSWDPEREIAKSSHVGWGSLKCRVSVFSPCRGEQGSCNVGSFPLVVSGARESAQLWRSWLEIKSTNCWGSSDSQTFNKYLRNSILVVQFHGNCVCTKHTYTHAHVFSPCMS